MINVLVTGGAGYIGSHTCKLLSRVGVTPIVYDNLSRGHRSAVKWGPLVVGDIRDTELLASTLQKNDVKTVVHFAALAYVGESVLSPDIYYLNNVEGTLSLLNAMVKAKSNNVVFSSSCAIYGTHSVSLISEDLAKSPINPYGRTKLICEQMIGDFSTAYSLNAVALRYFNASGADAEGEIGEWHEPETHIIPNILRTATEDLNSFTIHGSDYPTPDGTCVRDYIHVSDLAAAHCLAVSQLQQANSPGYSGYNLGTGRGYSVLEVLKAARELTCKTIACNYGPRREGDPHSLIADPSLIKRRWGWSAKDSDLKNILASAWAWHQKQIIGKGLS